MKQISEAAEGAEFELLLVSDSARAFDIQPQISFSSVRVGQTVHTQIQLESVLKETSLIAFVEAMSRT